MKGKRYYLLETEEEMGSGALWRLDGEVMMLMKLAWNPGICVLLLSIRV